GQIAPLTVGISRRPMMNDLDFLERPRGPAKHVRLHFVHSVPAGRADEAADLFPAFAPIHLRRAADMEERVNFRFDLKRDVDVDIYRSDANAEQRFGREEFKATLKIIGNERKIGVQLDDELPVRFADGFKAS